MSTKHGEREDGEFFFIYESLAVFVKRNLSGLISLCGAREAETGNFPYFPNINAPSRSVFKGVSFASLFRAPLDQAPVVCRLIRAAHESGAIVCAGTKIPTFRKMSLEELEALLPMIDYIFPNETEAAFLTGMSEEDADYGEMARRLLAKGIRHVVIKTGEKGCYAASPEECFAIPALKVPVVDTTGAGDNLVAGFIDALLKGQSFRDCCEAGIRTAADSVQHLGATE